MQQVHQKVLIDVKPFNTALLISLLRSAPKHRDSALSITIIPSSLAIAYLDHCSNSAMVKTHRPQLRIT